MLKWAIIASLVASAYSRATNQNYNLEDKELWTKRGVDELKIALGHEKIEGVAKNIILFIGDGLGVATHTMSRIYKGQKKGNYGEEEELLWDKFPFTGLIKTYNTDFQVPDSSGTATAILSGVKTRMAVVGLDGTARFNVCDVDNIARSKVNTVMDWAVDNNKQVGVVTTTRLTHATPASLYAKSPQRDWEGDTLLPPGSSCTDIARQMVETVESGNLKVAFGGGLKYFQSEANGGSRQDEDLVEYLKSKNVKILTTKGELDNWNYDEKTVGLFSSSHIPYEPERNKDADGQPSLAEMTKQAITRLKMNDDGYFLLVEGGRIDHAHHDNLAKFAMEETLGLESAVQIAVDMVDFKDTLVIVTADHSHSVTINGYPERGNDILGTMHDPARSTVMITPSGETQPYQTISYANGPGFDFHWDSSKNFWRNLSEVDYTANDYKFPAMHHLDYETHGGEDVPIYAKGPQAHLFAGVHEQNYVGILMGYAGCLKKNTFGCPSTNGAQRLSSVGSGLMLAITLLFAMN